MSTVSNGIDRRGFVPNEYLKYFVGRVVMLRVSHVVKGFNKKAELNFLKKVQFCVKVIASINSVTQQVAKRLLNARKNRRRSLVRLPVIAENYPQINEEKATRTK